MNRLKIVEITREPTDLVGLDKLVLTEVEENLSTIIKDNLITEGEAEYNQCLEYFFGGCSRLYGSFSRATLDKIYISQGNMSDIIRFFSGKLKITPEFTQKVLRQKPFYLIRDLVKLASGKIISSWDESNAYLQTQIDITLDHLHKVFGDISYHILKESGCEFILSELNGLVNNRLLANGKYDRVIMIDGSRYIIKNLGDRFTLTPVLYRSTYHDFATFKKVSNKLGIDTYRMTVANTDLDNIDCQLMGEATRQDGNFTLSYAVSSLELPSCLLGERTSNEIYKGILYANNIKGCSSAKKDELIQMLSVLIGQKISEFEQVIRDKIKSNKYILLYDKHHIEQFLTGDKEINNYQAKSITIFGVECFKDYYYKGTSSKPTFELLLNSMIFFTVIYKHLRGGIIFDLDYNNEAYTTHNIVSGLIKRTIPIPTTLLRVK